MACCYCGRNKHVAFLEELERQKENNRVLEDENRRLHCDYMALHQRLQNMRQDGERNKTNAHEAYVRDLEQQREIRRLQWQLWEQERDLSELRTALRQAELEKQVYRDITLSRNARTSTSPTRCPRM